jgi:phosphinothricin acetyltransferase
VDVSVYVDSARQRLGVGRALYASLFSALKFLGYYTALAGIALPNDASIGLHRSFGFEHVGTYREVGFKLGQWVDVSWWQREIQAKGLEPPEPRTLAQVVGSSEFQEARLSQP